jgi:hypothetical protein
MRFQCDLRLGQSFGPIRTTAAWALKRCDISGSFNTVREKGLLRDPKFL